MSWFGDTFGDSLNSLKGQISKITKEVLAEDDNQNEDEAEAKAAISQIKELDALCTSKDLEIHTLREEHQKVIQRFQEEIKFLQNENKKFKTDLNKNRGENLLLNDDQIQQVCELENQLHQLKIERDHLEELQKDHQSNICIVVQQKDNFKHELEKLKQEYSILLKKYNEVLDIQNKKSELSDLSDVNLKNVQSKEDEVTNLRNIVEKLQIQIETYQNEKEETNKVIEKHMLNSENLKERTEKLMEEIRILNSEKENLELENQKLQNAIEMVKSELNDKIDKLKEETNKNDELEKKLVSVMETLEVSKSEQLNVQSDLENKVKQFLDTFNITASEQHLNGNSLLDSIDLIKNYISNCSREREIAEDAHKKNVSSLEVEILKLKDENLNFAKDIKANVDKWNEAECKYKEEINSLQSKYLELKSQEQDCIIKSQTDDVKRLDQEVARLTEMVNSKADELKECYCKINSVTEELNATKSQTENNLLQLSIEKEKLEKDVERLNFELSNSDKRNFDEKTKYEERCKVLEGENVQMSQKIDMLQEKLNESLKLQNSLEDNVSSMKKLEERASFLEKELEEAIASRFELEKVCADMQNFKVQFDHQTENLKAKLIVAESSLSEARKQNEILTSELGKLSEETRRLQAVENELTKWKESMVDLEIQRQDLLEKKEQLESECSSLRVRLQTVQNTETVENQESVVQAECEQLKLLGQQQGNMIAALTYENNELKRHLQLTGERVMALNEENQQLKNNLPEVTHSTGEKSKVQQHRRSKSAAEVADSSESELQSLKELNQRQQSEYKTLQEEYNKVAEKEFHARKELERLRLHLIEIENDYTETIDEYKTKLSAAEEHLKNSSTLYTSTKVRDNQHLESLQSQIRLMATQRDDLQVKLSAAEDEVQKHEAALTSFQVVLEQFQQDKEREFENIATKYENQLLLADRRLAEVQAEVNFLNGQLADAKNGLKAASRLGEQLDKKSQQIAEMEGRLAESAEEMRQLEEKATLANQSSMGKIDKSLVKNLFLGYLSAQQPDRKTQVLRIMASVLEFDQDEKNKIGVDSTHSGWLSNLLHPKVGDPQSTQSLSEAFIRFLENESRPQPQIKLLPERSAKGDRSNSGTSTPKPSLLLEELVLPTFNSPQGSESTILKDVLKES